MYVQRRARAHSHTHRERWKRINIRVDDKRVVWVTVMSRYDGQTIDQRMRVKRKANNHQSD